MNTLNAFTVTIVNLFLVAYSDTSIAFGEHILKPKMQKEYINITSYLQQAETQARQILHYAFHRLLTPNSQFKDVNAAKAVNP